MAQEKLLDSSVSVLSMPPVAPHGYQDTVCP